MASYDISSRLFYALTGGRLVVLFALFSATLLLENSARLAFSFFLLFAFAFSATIAAVLWFKKRRLTRTLVYAYILSDLFIVSVAVYLTGRTESPLSFFYMLIVLSSCFFDHQIGPVISAGAATLAFFVMGAIELREGSSFQGIALASFVNMAALWLTALLGSLLARRLFTSREEVNRLRSIQDNLVDSLSSGLILVDEAGRVMLINRAGLKILEGLLSIRVGEKLEACWKEAWEYLKGINSGDQADRKELVYKDSSGGPCYIGISHFPLRDNTSDEDKILGQALIFQDITELKEQEKRLLRTDRLAALGEMAAGLAHELRNPLASMSGAAQFLARSKTMDDNFMRLLGIIEREAKRLNNLVESFLLYAHPERPQGHPKADVKVVVEEAVSLLEKKKGLPKATLEMEFKGTQKVAVPEDSLKQVVLNILSNAFEALSEKGGRVKVEGFREGEMVILAIEDTGVGIEDEELRKIFDPFYSTKPKGTGLGLAIVYSLVKSWGGEVDVRSKKGIGTRITIKLPPAPSGHNKDQRPRD